VRNKSKNDQLIGRLESAFSLVAEVLAASPYGFDLDLAPLSYWRANWSDRKIQKKFIENFIKIRSKHSGGKLIPFKFNDIQNHLHFKMGGRDVILKSRQQGVSTYILARKLCKAILFSGTNIRFVPHDPEAEDEFWNRLDIMFTNLPSHLKPDTRYYSTQLIQFQDEAKGVRDSRLVSLNPRPGGESKPRSLTLTDAHLTEIPFWAGDQEKTFTALMAASDKGEVTLESTPAGKERFYSYYQQGKQKRAGWRSHFFEWWWLRENRLPGYRFAKLQDKNILLEPDQSTLDIWNYEAKTTEEQIENRRRLEEITVLDEEIEVCEEILSHLKRRGYARYEEVWNCPQVAEYLAWRREKITELGGVDKRRGLKLFKIEHPENDVDCFDSSIQTIISSEYLKVTCNPINTEARGAQLDKVLKSIEGHRFVIGCDTSLGVEGGDPAAIEVLDIDTGRQAYSIDLMKSPDLLAYQLVEVSNFFNYAVIGVERNNTGIATLKKLAELVEPERIFTELTVALQRQVDDGRITIDEAFDRAEFGIATTAANKALFAIFLEESLRLGEIGLSSHSWCEQASTTVWLNSQKTQWGGMAGHHDDRVIALSIANYIRKKNYSELAGFAVAPTAGYAR
jgi:hypothetical protein